MPDGVYFTSGSLPRLPIRMTLLTLFAIALLALFTANFSCHVPIFRVTRGGLGTIPFFGFIPDGAKYKPSLEYGSNKFGLRVSICPVPRFPQNCKWRNFTCS